MNREDLRDQVTDRFKQSFGVNLIQWDPKLAEQMADRMYELVNLFGDDFSTAIYQMVDNYKRLAAQVDEEDL